jgi:FkbM family methyltransferase
MSSQSGLTVLFYPSFDNSEEFTDHYYRMMWYLNPLRERISRVVMPYEGEAPSVGALPSYLDSTIKQMADGSGMANAVELVSSEDIGLMETAAREADIVLVWRTGSGQGNRVPDGLIKPIVMKRKHYFVDHKHERFAGSFYLRLSAEICSNDATVEECKEKFKQIPADHFSKTGYIYGTGPSLQAALDMNLSDGTSIVCNTIVKNKELMRKLKPPIIVFSDPIFHAGCSSYAGDFRRHVLEAMAEFDSYAVVPMRDYCLYMANLVPSLRPRIIGIPIVPPKIAPDLLPNLNLYKRFQVTPTTSVLTLYLIPLAATFFEKIFILGCDGRPMNQDNYFWKHDPASQLVDRMDEIQVAHPAFFKIDYHDFYLEHCRVVARWLDEAERQGKSFLSLTPSYIPALKCRQVASSAILTGSRGIPAVSIIMPSFNASGTIAKALASIQFQSFTDWELVVVDDGSSDGTREVVTRLASADSRIRLVQSKSKGASDARNTGLDAARGEFITFLDADDFMYPGALERRVEALKKNPEWNLVHCVTELVDANSKELGWQLGRPKEVSFKYMSGNPCHINSLLGRSQVFKSVRFQAGLTNGEDWLFLSDILRTGEVSRRVDNCSVAYVICRDSVVCKDYLSHENKLLEALDMIYSPVRNNLPAAPEFAQGLSSPPKEAVILRRRTGLLTWLLLEERGSDVAAVLREFSAQALSALSMGDIRNQIVYPAMRFYICRQEELAGRLHKDRARVLRLISQTGVDKTFPRYAQEFKSLMGEAPESKLRAMQVSDAIIGPFKRNDHAHIDENALVAVMLVDQTKTGVMIDVGAMHGGTLSPFCRRGWRVFAFEPDPTNRKDLETRFGHNPNLTIDDRAVTDRVAENLPFYSSAESPGISSLHPFHKSHVETGMVSTTTIADFVRDKDLHHIDYLKIDAEGYDLPVLKGVPWHSIKPNVIMCEFEDRKTRSLGYTWHDMARHLTERGYKVLVSEWHPVIRYGIKHDWRRLVPYPCELDDPNATGNLIAFRDQPDLQRIATIAGRIVKVDKVAPRGGETLPRLRARGIYQRLVGYLTKNYPTVITMGRVIKWSLATLKKTFFGIGGICFLVTAGLYVAGALIEPLRWYLVGIASALLLLFCGLLALAYTKLWFNRFISDQRRSVKAVNDRLNRDSRDRTQLKATLDGLEKIVSASRAELEKALSASEATLTELRKEISDDKDALDGLKKALSASEATLTELRKEVKQIDENSRKSLSASEATLAGMKKEISDSKDTLAKMNVGNFPLFQPFNRRLTNEDLKRFAGEWAPKLGLNLDARAVGYIAHRICLAEDTCVGRLAGNIETMLLRVLVARSVVEPNLEVLEIGTLFGVGVVMIHENCRGLFDSQHFTVIDPLTGHIHPRHDKNSLDHVIKAPVTRGIFIHNMQRMNIPETDYTIIQRLSTEDEAIEQASKRRYNLLIIDGDHSYFGVKHDFYNYRHLVRRGGYIIFDDYDNPTWPKIKDFVDKEVVELPGLEFTGTDVRTAVFRIVTAEDSIRS